MITKLIYDNCLSYMLTLDAQSIDVILTDPPFSEHVHTSHMSGDSRHGCYGKKKELGFSSLTEDQRIVYAHALSRIARGWVLVFTDLESSQLWKNALCATRRLEYIRTGLWVKTNPTPQFSGDRPANGAEAIVICHPPGRKHWNGGGRPAVWNVPTETNRQVKRMNATQKPSALIKKLVLDFSNPHETIFDPFMGSGTTGEACVQLDRNFIGCEVDQQQFEFAQARIAQAQLVPKMFMLPQPAYKQEGLFANAK